MRHLYKFPLSIIILTILLPAALTAEDSLYLRSGEVIHGRMLRMGNDDVQFKNAAGEKNYRMSEICRLVLDETGDSGFNKECEDVRNVRRDTPVVPQKPVLEETKPAENTQSRETNPPQQNNVRQEPSPIPPAQSRQRGPIYVSFYGGTGDSHGSFVSGYADKYENKVISSIYYTDTNVQNIGIGTYNLINQPRTKYVSENRGVVFEYGLTNWLTLGLHYDYMKGHIENAPFGIYDGTPWTGALAFASYPWLYQNIGLTTPSVYNYAYALRIRVEFPSFRTAGGNIAFHYQKSFYDLYLRFSIGAGVLDGPVSHSPTINYHLDLAATGQVKRYEAAAGVRFFLNRYLYLLVEGNFTDYNLSYELKGQNYAFTSNLTYYPYISIVPLGYFPGYKLHRELYENGGRIGVGFKI